ncbi:[FeFe] hydrogenase H-cluster maturation GTPase HydF, partial [bacterium]|nr:[FeFe] hydrogenase H-cluster maturation GTPase HydF [bacterium]
MSMVIDENAIPDALDRLKHPPALVITDSQAFSKVAADVPQEILLTSFSILFARYKSNLKDLVIGTTAIDNLKPGDRVLIAEACTHHPITDDIGREKIPRWLTTHVGGALDFQHVQGHDFPDDISSYKLSIHCGGCMLNRREILTRLFHCRREGLPVSNYGLTIAYLLGIFERALAPFPDALNAYRENRAHANKERHDRLMAAGR